MRRLGKMITFIDLLMILAILLIVAGMVVPHFAKKSAAPEGPSAKDPAPLSRPLR